MAIQKHEIPILEYDDCAGSVIPPNHEQLGLQLPRKAVLATTCSTDGFFRETPEEVRCRKAEGCSVVEMECSALAACAQLRGAVWGELLYTADSLADVLSHDARGLGSAAREIALELCLDAAARLRI